MASSVVCTCYPTLPLHKYLGQLNRKPHARFLLPLPLPFFSPCPLWLHVAMIGALYVHKNQISLFVICNFLSSFILYVNGQFFMYIFILLYINCIYMYIFGRGARPFLASVQKIPLSLSVALSPSLSPAGLPSFSLLSFYINAASIVRWLAIENVTCMRHGGISLPPTPYTLLFPLVFAKKKGERNRCMVWVFE